MIWNLAFYVENIEKYQKTNRFFGQAACMVLEYTKTE